jgi:DNA helicase II / ATP-dependent DNA helicase PcrA
LSAPVTFIAGCVDGLLPKQPDSTLPQAEQLAELEEQRRLFYVGISRVKAVPAQGKVGTLILTYAQNMSVAHARSAGINPAYSSYNNASLLASRFIAEMAPAAPRSVAG